MPSPEVFPIILHVDLDSFYPSVEVREHPELRGLPIVVGSDPKGGSGRGVVMSCSYEARKLGIRAGQPISIVYKKFPEAIYLKPNFPLYSEVSRRVLAMLRGFADVFEQVSIDEAFLDVSRTAGTYEGAEKIARLIKSELKEKERGALTCSIGIAPNKSSAKIAADFGKPDGLTVVLPQALKKFLAPLPVSAITGIGNKTEAFLDSIGVRTIADLQAMQGEELVKHFGKTGVWLWGVANGLERIPVRGREGMKSLSAEHTFDRDVEDKALVMEKLGELAERLHGRLVSAKYKFRVVGIKIRFSHFQTFTRESTVALHTNEKSLLLQEARNLFKEFEKDSRKVRLIGVRVSDIVVSGENSGSEAPSPNLERWFDSS
ncbi:MAG TPA: DNA polymerase IV [Nitrososphaerales archaeon]|nr:DNA polymerase IV [Nitrososphaerales archaeon]